MIEGLLGLLIVAILVEAIIETGKMVAKAPAWEHAVSFLCGSGMALLFSIPFIETLPVELAFNGDVEMVVNAFFIGVLILRYSGNVNGLLEFVKYLASLGKKSTPTP